MPTFKINNDRVKVIDDQGDSLSIESSSSNYLAACQAALSADWSTFRDLFFDNTETNSSDEPDEITIEVRMFENTAEAISVIRGLIEDELITLEDIGLSVPATEHGGHEHDLSNWNGSPIFYPTREMARAQSDRWGMFWAYHDFGISSPPGYRYATVPLGVGPTAPDGYDWVCLPREE